MKGDQVAAQPVKHPATTKRALQRFSLSRQHPRPPTKTHALLSALAPPEAPAIGPLQEVPFSVFPSSYRNQEVSESSEVKTDERVTVQGAGREDRRERFTSQAGPSRRDGRTYREDVRITEQDRYRRAGRERREEDFREDIRDDIRVRNDERYIGAGRHQEQDRVDTRVDVEVDRPRYRQPYQRYTDAQIDVQDRDYDREYPTRHTPATQIDVDSRIDIAERDFRDRTTPFTEEYRASRGWQDKSTYPRDYPVEGYPAEREPVRLDEKVRVEERTVDEPREGRRHKRDMGYYDEDGHYHSFRHGLHRAADRILHPFESHERHEHHHRPAVEREEDITVRDREVQVTAPRYSEREYSPRRPAMGAPNTITIPCHHIRIGDLLILQGRPCQVIRITTSAQTGQHRYLGVDLFTKQLHEESSFVSNPSPSVVVQNMIGPVFKQYRVLDIRDDGRVVAMTETGDVKQGLPVLDQSSLLNRLTDAFNNGRGSVRVLVISDEGRELAVDYKVVHGSRL
ncbi:Woronin body major [Lecanosticta acicola]|uniref:Woronin body major n=1 Tax=Lecanosticta acicola TaxID=111012 RepID=A0AAI9EBT3_9PEZI|nr:Woronin body major [Lecanosticta acicola]